MAVRTTDANVREVLEVDPVVTDLTPFIEMASELVDERCTDSGYTAARLEKIERLLAAHFVCLRDMRLKNEKAGSVGATLDTELDLLFYHTHHGQMALLMDTAGNLAALMEEIKAGGVPTQITWLGTEED